MPSSCIRHIRVPLLSQKQHKISLGVMSNYNLFNKDEQNSSARKITRKVEQNSSARKITRKVEQNSSPRKITRKVD